MNHQSRFTLCDLTDDELRTFLHGVNGNSSCIDIDEQMEMERNIKNMPRAELIQSAKELIGFGHELKDHLNMKIVKFRIKKSRMMMA